MAVLGADVTWWDADGHVIYADPSKSPSGGIRRGYLLHGSLAVAMQGNLEVRAQLLAEAVLRENVRGGGARTSSPLDFPQRSLGVRLSTARWSSESPGSLIDCPWAGVKKTNLRAPRIEQMMAQICNCV